MDRRSIYEHMNGMGDTDYEIYLNTRALFSCQKDFDALCNRDEMQFQIVHQVQELLMKIIIYSLLDINDYIKAENTNRVLTLFHRIHSLQEAMIHMFSLLDTMSPKEYQEIRVNLGNGSGQESPGFRTLIKMGRPLWDAFKTHYLDKHNLTLKNIYDDKYSHCDAYVIAEAMASYDEMFQRFRYHHLQHIQRSIGLGSKSLKGRPVELLKAGLNHRFFPDLWNIRDKMTDQWSTKYGDVRDSLRSL